MGCVTGRQRGQRSRPVPEIKLRGRWAADSSLKRYMKHTRLLTELNKVPAATLRYGALVSERLADLLGGLCGCPPPSCR